MVDRKPFIDGPGPHEKRFDYLELPSIYSNVNWLCIDIGEETFEYLLQI